MINSGAVRPGLSFRPHSPGLPQGHFGKSEDRTSCAVLPRRDTNTSEPVRESSCGLVWSCLVLSGLAAFSVSKRTCLAFPMQHVVRCPDVASESRWAWPGLRLGKRLRLWFRAFHHTSASWHHLTPWAPRCSSHLESTRQALISLLRRTWCNWMQLRRALWKWKPTYHETQTILVSFIMLLVEECSGNPAWNNMK